MVKSTLNSMGLTTTRTRKSEKGTIGWMAPEVKAYGQAVKPADIYSTAMVFYEMVEGRKPWFDCVGDQLDLIATDYIEKILSGYRPPMTAKTKRPAIDGMWRKLISAMWEHDPNKRM